MIARHVFGRKSLPLKLVFSIVQQQANWGFGFFHLTLDSLCCVFAQKICENAVYAFWKRSFCVLCATRQISSNFFFAAGLCVITAQRLPWNISTELLKTHPLFWILLLNLTIHITEKLIIFMRSHPLIYGRGHWDHSKKRLILKVWGPKLIQLN